MTDLASLAISVDSTGVKTGVNALDDLTAASMRAEDAVDDVGDASLRSAKDMQTAAQAATKLAQETQDAARAATTFVSGAGKAGTASKLASHHIANLSFQLNDVATMAAMGMDPLKIFASQAGQVFQIMQQSGLGVGGFTKEVGLLIARLGPAVAVLGAVAEAFALITDEVNENAKTQVSWGDVVLGTYDAIVDFLGDQVEEAFRQLGTTTDEVWNDIVDGAKWMANMSIASIMLIPRTTAAVLMNLPHAVADAFYSAVQLGMEAINKLVEGTRDTINDVVSAFNGAFGTSIPSVIMGTFKVVDNPFAGGMKKMASAGIDAVKDTFKTDYIGNIADWVSPYAQARARARTEKDAKKAGKQAGKAFGKDFADEVQKAFDKMFQTIPSPVGSTGALFGEGTLEDETIRLYKDAAREANKASDERITNMRMEADAAEYLQQQYAGLAQALGNLGGTTGKVLGALSSILTGNTVGVGGKLGGLLAGVDQAMGGSLKTVFKDVLTGVFGEKAGNIAGPLNKALQGAGMGVAAGSIFMGGKGSSGGAAAGGAIGGALGEKFLTKGLESVMKGLGPLAGPIGSIAGGIIGSALGGLLKKTKSGSATITGMGEATLGGNSGGFKQAASGAAGSVQQGLGGIADALGGAVGSFSGITIGQRDGKWRVNSGGTSLKVKKGAKDFGDDEAAAVAHAISLAVQQGAITGLRASTQRLLQGGGDIEAQLQKALSFEGVLAEFRKQTDPVGFALEEIGKEFENITKIAREAGATAEEYGQIEAVFAKKRKDALEESTEAMRDFLAQFDAGSNSPFSLRQQSANSRAALQPFIDAINAGKQVDQDKYLKAAQTFLDVERQINGSGQGYFDALKMIQDTTNKAISDAENVASLSSASDQTAKNTEAMSNMMADQNNILLSINDNLIALQRGGTAGWLGDTRGYA